MNRILSMVPYVFFSLFLLVGLAVLGMAGRAWWKSNLVEAWPTTSGTLLARELAEDSDSDGTTYRVKVRYAYTVAGRRYESDRLAFGYMGTSGQASHQAIYDKLSSGNTVQVRYDPADPSQAALAYGMNKSILMVMLFGGVWTMFVLGLMLFFLLGGMSDTQLLERLIVR